MPVRSAMHGRLADLQRACDAALVEDGLAVAADQFDRCAAALRRAGLDQRFGVQFAQLEVQARDIAAVCVVVLETARMASRTAVGYGRACGTPASRCCGPRMSTMATSMPSSDVPLMMPGYSHDRFNSSCSSASSCSASMGRSSSNSSAADALGDLVVHRLEQLDLHGPRAGARRQFFGHHVLGLLVQLQHLARALDHAQRQAGQPRHFDAVAAVGLARLHFAQEDDVVARFLHRDLQVAHAVELLGQLGQLVIMRGEQRLGARALRGCAPPPPRPAPGRRRWRCRGRSRRAR